MMGNVAVVRFRFEIDRKVKFEKTLTVVDSMMNGTDLTPVFFGDQVEKSCGVAAIDKRLQGQRNARNNCCCFKEPSRM